MTDKRVLTIEANYCANWTVEDALRELIQNAIDTGKNIELTKLGRFWEIKDYGNGLSLSDFLVGRSSKRDDSKTIGQFGEGAPIGCLVLARANREVKVYSNGKLFVFSFEYYEQWESRLLTITIDDMPTDKGTTILVECYDEEIEAAKSKFLYFSPKHILSKSSKCDILNATGLVYVNGLQVSTITSLFGYNFKGQKELVNRDRNAIGYSEIKGAIKEAIGEVSNSGIICQILTTAVSGLPSGMVETDLIINIKHPRSWKAAIKKLFGDKVCLSHDPVNDVAANENNWVVLDLPWGLNFALCNILKDSEEVLKQGNNKKYIQQKDLNDSLLDVLREGRKIADWVAGQLGLKTYPIKVFRNLNNGTGSMRFNQRGEFVPKRDGGEVEIEVGLLEKKDVTVLVGTILHEYTHGTTGSADNTRDFENELTDIISVLGVKCYTQAIKLERSNYEIKNS